MSTLVDANVLLDVSTRDPSWAKWSVARLREASGRGMVVINPIIYAEFSVGYATMQRTDEILAEMGIVVHPIPTPHCFQPEKSFSTIADGEEREPGSSRTSSSARTRRRPAFRL